MVPRTARRPDDDHASGWDDERIYTEGDAWFRDLLTAIAAARTSIWLETYLIAPDALGERVLAALAAAARRGCEVRLLVDGAGAANWLRQVNDPGVPLRVWNPMPWAVARRAGLYRRWRWLTALNRRDHRKVCLIDGTLAWVGSFNVAGCHTNELAAASAWRDSGACVRGPGLTDLRAAFARAWRKAWPTADGRVSLRLHLPDLLRPAGPAPPPSPHVRLNHTWATRRATYADLLQRIRSARTRIWITNAYVVPRGSLLRALGNASARGVDVRLLAPANADVLFMPWVGAIFADALLARGVRVFAYLPRMLHAKTMLIDESALVGSHNLNSRSFLHDLEAEVVLAAPASITALASAYIADCAEANELTGGASRRLPWPQRLIGRVLLLAKRFL